MQIKYLLLTGWLFLGFQSNAQGPLTLEQCYEKARTNYPLIRQKNLIAQSTSFSIANARAGFFPQVSINGQATYQSDVTRVPLEVPGFKIQALSKDQYKIYAEVNQSLYDGGAIRQQTKLQQANAQVEDQKVEVELYKINERINQLYFGVLLLDEQLKQIALVQKDLESSLQKVQSGIRNGTAFKTNADILQAELLKVTQRTIETQSARQAYLDMLGLFLQTTLNENTVLERPAALPLTASSDINRPELKLFNYQNQLLSAQQQLSNTRTLPRVNLFVQGGYGKPGLNALLNEFDTYYIGGIRLNWNLSGFYNTRRDRELLTLNVQSVDAQRDAFVFNTNLSLRQQNNEIVKLQKLLEVDRQLIDLRANIKVTSKAQLENGVITANDYLRELNAEDQARQNEALHTIQLLLTAYTQKNTIGN